eukprot:2190985-Prymnesium_polylepis.1
MCEANNWTGAHEEHPVVGLDAWLARPCSSVSSSLLRSKYLEKSSKASPLSLSARSSQTRAPEPVWKPIRCTSTVAASTVSVCMATKADCACACLLALCVVMVACTIAWRLAAIGFGTSCSDMRLAGTSSMFARRS